MELVLTLLAVALLIVLPITFFLLAIWGLFYGVFRGIRGEKKEEKQPATSVVAPWPTRGADVAAVKVASANGLAEAARLGFTRALVPAGSGATAPAGLTVTEVDTLGRALAAAR